VKKSLIFTILRRHEEGKLLYLRPQLRAGLLRRPG